jgi:hypothetical protein
MDFSGSVSYDWTSDREGTPIADLGCEEIQSVCVAEALQYVPKLMHNRDLITSPRLLSSPFDL